MLTGKLTGLARGRKGSQTIMIAVDSDFREEYDELRKYPVTVEIKRYRKGRSLNANSYAWVLINKNAQKLQEKEPKNGWTPLEVYRKAILDVAGACTHHYIPEDQAEQFARDWRSMGLGFQVEMTPCIKPGWVDGWFWKGSHLYDTQQMSTLINILIQEAEGLGIPTISDKEVEQMLGGWKKAEERRNNHGTGKADQEAG